MKLKELNKMLLAKEDMDYKNKLEKQVDEMFEKVKEYKKKLMDENIASQDKNTLERLYKSSDKYNELIRTYNNCEECIPKIVIGFMFSLAGIFVLFESPMIGEWQIMLSTIVAIFGGLYFLVTGIKQCIIKSKIKKNFKELGIELG
jgi:hypothetical protein